MSIRKQAARLLKRNWRTPSELAQEVFRVLVSKDFRSQPFDSANLAPTAFERRLAEDVMINSWPYGPTSLLDSVITIRPAVNALLFFTNTIDMQSTAASGLERVWTQLRIDGDTPTPTIQGNAGWTAAVVDGGSNGQKSATRTGFYPLRGGVTHKIGWELEASGSFGTVNVKKEWTRLTLLVLRLDNADIVTRL